MDDDDRVQADPIDEALSLAAALPAAAVSALFARYGRPLADPLPPVAAGERATRLGEVAAGVRLRVVNLRTAVDVIGNDWFVLEAAGLEPLAIAGPLFAAALAALARAARPVRDEG